MRRPFYMPHRPLNEAIEHLKSGTSQVAKKSVLFSALWSATHRNHRSIVTATRQCGAALK